MIATGGGDAVINLWHDSTAADKEEAFHKEEEGVLRGGQELENPVFDADYIKAVRLAFELRRPQKLFELFSELCRKPDGKSQIEKAVCPLSKEEVHKLMEYIRDWNTKPKLCHVAHFVLSRLFSIIPPTEIIEIKGIGELLEGLIPYTQRHFSRVDKLGSNTFLLDYTLAGMSVLEPEGMDTESSDEDMNHSDLTEEELIPAAVPSRKKRQSQKSQDEKQKRSKVAYTSLAATAIY